MHKTSEFVMLTVYSQLQHKKVSVYSVEGFTFFHCCLYLIDFIIKTSSVDRAVPRHHLIRGAKSYSALFHIILLNSLSFILLLFVMKK